MNQSKHFNNVIKRMANAGGGGCLPAEYQQVEYLQSSGTQYLDTGVKAGNDLTVQAKIVNNESAQGTSQNRQFLGARTGATNRFFTWVFDWGGNIYYGYRDTYASTGKSWGKDVVYEFSITISNSLFSIVLHGDYGWSWSTSISQQFSGDINLYMLSCNDWNNGNPANNHFLKGQVYYCKIEKNGTLVRDFIPCYRKSDNKPGMYDLVTDTFLTNAGSGEFTVGDNT